MAPKRKAATATAAAPEPAPKAAKPAGGVSIEACKS